MHNPSECSQGSTQDVPGRSVAAHACPNGPGSHPAKKVFFRQKIPRSDVELQNPAHVHVLSFTRPKAGPIEESTCTCNFLREESTCTCTFRGGKYMGKSLILTMAGTVAPAEAECGLEVPRAPYLPLEARAERV